MIVTIDQDLCIGCGVCGIVCPRHIPVTEDKKTRIAPERVDLCMQCGHCTAVCPKQAIEVEPLKDAPFPKIEKLDIDSARLLTLMRQRRSVRRYKDKPVPREEIDRLIEAVQCAPTGTGRSTTGVIVIDDKEKLSALSERVFGVYEKLEGALKNPVGRFFVKQKAGKRNLSTLQNFVMPGMQWYIRWYREGKSNEIMRDCPALMLFHSPVYEPMGNENCAVAAFHAIVMAQVTGLGTCFNDLIPPACNRDPEIRKMLGLSDDREIFTSVTIGYAKYPFKRVAPRKLAEVRYL